MSYNSFDTILIKYLFTECPLLEQAYLVNNLDRKLDYEASWQEIISCKFEDSNSVPLKQLEIKSNNINEINDIKNLFKKKWFKNMLKLNFLNKNIVEFIVS